MASDSEPRAIEVDQQPLQEPDRQAQAVGMEEPPRLPFVVVGIGASAGGLEASIEFFDAMPSDSGMAFVLIQHLPPDRESMIADILSKHTQMTVVQIENGMAVQPNHVYVIRPGFTPTIKNGHLHLGEPLSKPGHNRPVDDFFKSLAEEQRERSMCVILSGMGSNGTAGTQAIKAVGGLAIAQDPDTAKFPSMPRSVLDAGYADFLLRPSDMPQALVNFAAHPYASRSDSPEAVLDQELRQFNEIVAILRTRVRHDFSGYKRPTVLRRIQRRMGLHQLQQMSEYVTLLRQNPPEATALSDDLMIHVTGFFRDPEAWEALRVQAIVPLIASRQEEEPIRCWVTACCSGEEAYTLAMLLIEAAEAANKSFDIKVFATDTAERTLAQARNGIYPGGIEAEVTPARLERFFERDDAHYRIKKEVRERVVFAPQNVVQDPPFSRLDICTCRNLLIYLEPELQRRVMALLHFGLREGGILFLGTSETVHGADDLFQPIDKRTRIFRRMGPKRGGLSDFSFPMQRGSPHAAPALQRPLSRPSIAHLTDTLLLEKFTPAAATINARHEVVYIHGDANAFLIQPPGEPTRDILSITTPTLRGALRTALHEIATHESGVSTRAGFIGEGHDRQRVEVAVAPLNIKLSPGHMLVTFRRVETPVPPVQTGNGDSDPQQVHAELRRVQDELQSTIEELQSSNEEMKASSEEVMSINEELQSTNEELETSKEELQSMNEELRTLNAQLQNKMEEHEATSSDLTSLLTSTDIAVLFLDEHLRIRRSTPKVKDLFELIPGDIGRPITDLAKKFVDPELAADCQAVLERLIPREREVTSNTSRIYVRQILPYRAANNQIGGVVITFVDITDRKHIEDALRQSEERQRVFIEGAPDYAMLLIDLEGKIAAWNVGAQRMLGYSEEEALGRSAAIIFPADKRTGALEREMRDATKDGRGIDEGWRVRKDGTRFWGNGILAPVHNSSGEITGFVKVLRDESVRKMSDQERAELLQREQTARHEAEHATELKDKFLATLSHELRTPLSSMLMWAQMLADRKVPDDAQEEGLRVILRSAEAQRQLLDDLLDTSRIASGKVRLNVSRVGLAPLVRAAIEAIRPLADEKQVKLELALSDELTQLYMDPNRIRQVLNNLLTNAIKFTPAGGQITMATLPYEGGAEIRVTDTGVGIEPRFLPHVFTAFSQADSKSNRAFGGLGLGLAIAKQFVEMHGGTISARSSGRDQGATFIVRLPLGQSVGESQEAEDTSEDAEPTDAEIDGISILLVEDDAGSRDALARFLISEGAQVQPVDSADLALSEFQKLRPDVIISDIGLPGKDGYEFMQELRTWETEQKVTPTPALALTAFAGREDSRKAREAGYQQHLAKPINVEQVVKAIAVLINRE